MRNPSFASSGNVPAGCTEAFGPRALRAAALTAALCACAAPLRADGVRLQASVDPREATVGDPVLFTVTVALPAGFSLETPDVGKALGPFEVLGTPAAPPAPGDGATRTFAYTLAAFDVGVSTIPSLTLRARDAGGAVREFTTAAIPVTIKSVLGPDGDDIRDIKGVVRVPPRWGLVLTALAGLALLVAAVVLWRRRRARALLPAEPPRPAHETALEALDRLAADLEGPSKLFYTRLSGVLRAYLAGRFRVPALDLTTAEILQAMRRADLGADHARRAREVLEASDLAKFAKWEIPAAERAADIDKIRAFVRETLPPPPEEED